MFRARGNWVGLKLNTWILRQPCQIISGKRCFTENNLYIFFFIFYPQMYEEYKKISKYCDPKATSVDLIADGIRPLKPPSVPDFE